MTVDALKGSLNKAIKQKRLDELPGFNAASAYKKAEVERIIKVMIGKKILCETYVINENFGGINTYLRFGQHAEALRGGQQKLAVPFATRAARDADARLTIDGGEAKERDIFDDLHDELMQFRISQVP